MKWKILGILGAILIGCGGLAATTSVWAAPGDGEATSVCNGTVLGFKPWYEGLTHEVGDKCEIVPVCEKNASDCPDGSKTINVFIWTAVLNIMFDLSLAVGIIAVGIVIYGGYLYMMSQGDPMRATRGKKTLTSAVIGVVIAMGASVLVNTAKVILGITVNAEGVEGGSETLPATYLQDVFNWAYIAAGIVAVGFIIKNAVDYLISTGDPGKIQKATRGIIFSIVGLVVVLLAAAITNFVITSVGGAM